MKMSRALRTILEKIDDEVSRDLITSERTDHGDYLGIRSGFITYLPRGKDTEYPYASKNRVRAKAARAARKFTAEEHTDAAYEQFHLSLLTRAFSVKDLDVVKGEDIVHIYTDAYDRRRQSSMMNSCMTNLPRDHYRLYTEYPEHVRMLVLWDTFKGTRVAVGRALLWKTDKGIYADRIYGSEPAIIFLRNYIDKKGWMRYNSSMRGEITKLHVGIEFDLLPREEIPFLDTFRLRRMENGRITIEGVVARHG